MPNRLGSGFNDDHGDVCHLLEAPQRKMTGRIACLYWAVGGMLTVGYASFFDHHMPWTALIVVVAAVMTFVCAFAPWDKLPASWLVSVYYVGIGNIVASAIDMELPAALAILFSIAVLFAVFYWNRTLMLVVHLVGVYAVYAGFAIAIGGSDELSRVLIFVPLTAASALLTGYSLNRFTGLALQQDRFQATVTALISALRARDGYTADHSQETLVMVLGVADEIGFDTADRKELADVAILHDIGKIGIPNDILNKNGPLDDNEWEIMRRHPVIGEEILRGAPGFENVASAVRHEHERWDGGGYPDGISGEDIPLASRIVLACDAFHAMTSDRPYRKAMSREAAFVELRDNAGSQFDPEIVDALIVTMERSASADAATAAEQIDATPAAAAIQAPMAAGPLSIPSGSIYEEAVTIAAPPEATADDSPVATANEPRDLDSEWKSVHGRIGCAQWLLGAVVLAAYLVLFPGIDLVGAGLVGACLVGAAFSLYLPTFKKPMRSFLITLLVTAGVVTLAAYHYDEPSLTLFMLLPCSHGAMLRRSKSGFAALATIVTFVFCGVPLLVGGSEQWAWVPIAALALAVSVVVHSYFGAQIPEMQFERRRFASTAAALLIALGARDGYTAEHSEATVELTLEVADELGLGTDERSQLIDVALLHDVGKIGIPNEVLQKPSKLTEDEWEVMRQHPVIGEDIVSRVPGYEAVAKAIRHEHERWDGGGYPDGISGETIPLASRIVLACDAFHAMTSDRPYRQAMPLEDACDELLRSAGTQLDPNVVTALVATLERKHGALASAEGALWRRRPALARALATS